MGLDIYFYKTNKKNVVNNDASDTFKSENVRISNQNKVDITKRVNSVLRAKDAETRDKRLHGLFRQLKKLTKYNYFYQAAYNDMHNNVFNEQNLNKILTHVNTFSIGPKEAFYARKEWWIPEYIWANQNISCDVTQVFISRDELQHLSETLERAINNPYRFAYDISRNPTYDSYTAFELKRMNHDIKQLLRSLKDDDVIYARFSY